MLKKAGIIVAAAAAGLLTLSPLAFAGEAGGHAHHGAANDHSPSCSFGASNDNSVRQDGLGYSALLGALGSTLNTAAPVNAQTQAPVGSCNNLENIANITVKDNFQDNSTTKSDSKTVIKDSGNTSRHH